MRCAWVFAGGNFQVDDVLVTDIRRGDVVVGVDHGIAHCLRIGVVPTVLVGDFDSIDPAILNDQRLVNVPRRSFPARKNSSDLELALQGLVGTDVSRVILLGISGGRSDHHLFNWLLPFQTDWPFAVELVDHSVHAHVVCARYPLHVSAFVGQTISLLALPEAIGVTTKGLEYPLVDHTMTHGSTLGLSNVADADAIRVSVSAGRLLVFRIRADKMSALAGNR